MPIRKIKGQNQKPPQRADLKTIIVASLGAFIAISIVTFASGITHSTLLLGSFGAICLLIFAYPDAPFSQPRNVFFGHVLTVLIAMLFMHFLGYEWYSVALATSVAIAFMMLLNVLHPPAASNPLIVFLAKPAWWFLLFPTASGAIMIILFGLIYMNLVRHEKYPAYW